MNTEHPRRRRRACVVLVTTLPWLILGCVPIDEEALASLPGDVLRSVVETLVSFVWDFLLNAAAAVLF